ncbi:MAG: acyl carrier protein phosphodiesterase [Flavobacteriaceae bacterium]
MNFLAHLYLSESNTNIMIGNFIADHIRGNHFTHLHPEIQQGIKLHREIDTFTDAHSITRKSKRRLNKRYGLYAGIIIDIFYDHYLAKNWKDYSAVPLDIYVDAVYDLLESKKEILPEKTLYMMPFMIDHNWLYNYQYKKGIQSVLNGMNRRTKNKGQMDLAIEDLNSLDTEFQKDFQEFFEDLRIFSHQKLEEITLK